MKFTGYVLGAAQLYLANGYVHCGGTVRSISRQRVVRSQGKVDWSALPENGATGKPSGSNLNPGGSPAANLGGRPRAPAAPVTRNLVSMTPAHLIPDDYAARQLTMNRVRDAVVSNKEELMCIIRSTDIFTRAGKAKMDDIVAQLVVSAPLDRPATHMMLDGRWVRQGVIGHETQFITVNTPLNEDGQLPSTTSYKYHLGGLVVRMRQHLVTPVDHFTFKKEEVASRVSLCGLVNWDLPRRPGTTEVQVLYLDSDLQITAVRPLVGGGNGGSGKATPPQVFLKPDEFNEQVELRLRKQMQGSGALMVAAKGLVRIAGNPWVLRSPFRLRDRLRGKVREVQDDAAAALAAQEAAKARSAWRGAGQGLIGEVDFYDREGSGSGKGGSSSSSGGGAVTVTEEDLLGRIQAEGGRLASDFVVGDLLSGKVKRKIQSLDKLKEKREQQ